MNFPDTVYRFGTKHVLRTSSCLYERCQTAAGAFAKLTFAQRFCDRFQVRNTVYVKILKFRIRGEQMQPRLAQQPHSQRLAKLEMIDTEEFQTLLNLGEQAPLEFDPLRGNFVVRAPAPHIEA